MEIKFVFHKSSSKYYDDACLLAEGFDGYIQEGYINTVLISFETLRVELLKCRKLLGIINNWKKTEYYIDDRPVELANINSLINIIECESECSKCMFKEEYCYEGTGWGCKQISAVALREGYYYPYSSKTWWYEFGSFENDLWIIDKSRIKELVEAEKDSLNVTNCMHFDNDRILKHIDNLPEFINVEEDENWEYKYRTAPMGMKQTEIIGVQPVNEEDNDTTGISVFGFLNGRKDNEQKDERNVPNVTFSEIGGIDDIVQQVREVIELPLIFPDLFEHYKIKPHKGILLYGPPGCGKTLIAKAVANEINAHFIPVSGPEILNKYVGQSESNLRKIFDEAKQYSPTVIYFDEFDSISATRDAEGNPLMSSVVNQLLTLMDGISDNSKICAIASTNRIDMIDEAIKRPGRFDYVIEIERPSVEGCKQIFKIHTNHMPVSELFNKEKFVEAYLTGCSGADIAFVAAEAAYNSIRRTVDIHSIFEDNGTIEITDDNMIIEADFVKAVNKLTTNRKRAESAKWRY